MLHAQNDVRLSMQAPRRTQTPAPPAMRVTMRSPHLACPCGGGCPRCSRHASPEPKPEVSRRGDAHEREADRAADEFGKRAPPNFKDIGKVREPVLKAFYDYQIPTKGGVWRRVKGTTLWLLFPK